MRAPGVALALSAALALATTTAAAQPAGRDPDAARARELFERAVELMRNEDWSAALVQLEESFRLRPTQVALFNMGLCLKGLRRYGAAIRAFERLILEFSDRGANRVELARAEVQGLRALFGTVEVVVDAPGVELRVDGDVVGVSPLAEPLELAAGNHVIAARREGFRPAEQSVAVIAGAAVTVHLAPAPIDAPAPAPEVPPRVPRVDPPPPSPPAPRLPTSPPAAGSRGPSPAFFWSAVGLAGAGAIATAILGGLVVAGDADYRSSRVRLASDREDGRRLALYTDVALGVSVVAAVGAVLFYAKTDFGGGRDAEGGASSSNVSLDVRADACSVVLSGAFF